MRDAIIPATDPPAISAAAITAVTSKNSKGIPLPLYWLPRPNFGPMHHPYADSGGNPTQGKYSELYINCQQARGIFVKTAFLENRFSFKGKLFS